MVNFLLCDLNRASFSVGQSLVNVTVVQLCEVVLHGRQLGVHVRVSLLACSTARSLLGRWRRLHDLLLRYLDSILLQLVGRHALGKLLQHLVVTAPLPCLSENLSVVLFE